MHRSAFTLIELLIVIAVIAIVAVVVVLVLNPAELLRQSRDSNRLADLATTATAFSVYSAQGGAAYGSSSVVYVSISDPAATSTAGDQCQGLGLIPLPSSYTYHCAASSTYRSTNGTGWMPVNLGTLSGGSPLGQLPIDPVNSFPSRLYDTYTTNGAQYELTTVLESQKYKLGGEKDAVSGDGGTLASVYEKGTGLGLEPLDYGDSSLVGLWTFEEGTGTVAYDYSGNNATGSWSGTQAGTSGYYSTGNNGPWAGTFDGSTDYVNLPSSLVPHGGSAWQNFTVSAWINTGSSNYQVILADLLQSSGSNETTGNFVFRVENNQLLHAFVFTSNNTSPVAFNSAGTVPLNQWVHVAMISQNNAATITLYIDGAPSSVLSSQTYAAGGTGTHIGYSLSGDGTAKWNGSIDDVRIYNRALSASEITALYNGRR